MNPYDNQNYYKSKKREKIMLFIGVADKDMINSMDLIHTTWIYSKSEKIISFIHNKSQNDLLVMLFVHSLFEDNMQ